MDQNVENYRKYHFLKKTLKFLISISLFSFLLSYSSALSPFHHSIYCYFRKFPFPELFTHTVERKYMFLICNGILAFLSRNLEFRSSSRVGSTDLGKDEDDGKSSSSKLSETKESVVDKEEALESNGSVENFVLVAEGEQEQEEVNESLNTEVDESGALVIEEEEEEEEEEGNEEFSSTEELNKKFDEFIRRMKEDLRIQELGIQAQRQLIAV